LKILHIIPDLSAKTGGPVAALKSMSSSQVELGHEVSIITTDYDLDKNIEIKNVKILYFNCNIGAIRYSRSLKKYLKDNIVEFDIVHIHTIWQYPTFIAGKICKKYNIPYILRPCGMLDKWSFKQKKLKKTVYYNLIEKKTIKNASAIHCTSKLEEKESAKHLINSIIFIIPLSINISPKLKQKTISKPYILYLSRLHYKKQPDLLIKSFSKIINDYPKYQLVFAGPCENTYMQKLLNLIRIHKLEENVILKGMVVGKNKENLLANADIFVLPSHHENFGIAVAEAMGAGLPVIVGEKVALSDDIIKHNAGLVVKLTGGDIAKAMKELLNSPAKRKVMGNNGYEYVKNHLSKEKIAKQLINKYKTIINGK
jgi:glycosyltransferase involved in cell wall biosynthesis